MSEVHSNTSAPADWEVRAAEGLEVQLLDLTSEGPFVRTWRAKNVDGREVALHVVRPEVAGAERARFVDAAERIRELPEAIPGVLRVLAVSTSRDAIVTELCSIGSAKEIAGLAWPTRRRLDFVRRVTLAVGSLHRAGIVHGCLCEDNVLLGDNFEPILAEAHGISVHALVQNHRGGAAYVAFAAPELLEGAEADVRSDVFAIGRLLQHVLRGDDVPAIAEVITKCVAPLPFGRYRDANELASAIAALVGSGAGAAPPAPAPRPHAPPTPKAEPHRRPSVSGRPSDSPFAPPPWLAPGGIVVMVVAVLLAFVLGGSNASLRTALATALFAGAATTSMGLRQARPASAALRGAFALACAVLVVVFNPLSFGYRFAAARAVHGSETSRRAAIEQVVRLGRDFRGLSLARTDLSGFNLRGADFREVDLSGANLSRTNLWGAMLRGAALGGADLVGADLQGTDLDQARDVDLAECSTGTRFPKPWHCARTNAAGTGRPSNEAARP